MSLFKQLVFVSGAAVALVAPVTEASAQFYYYDRPAFERPRTQHRLVEPRRPQNIEVGASRKPAVSAGKPAVQSSKAISKPVPKPVPPAPLTEEQLAAKAAVDELLAREPSLNAARAIPDPALARAAAVKHSAEEARLAALKAKQESDAAKRRAAEEKNKAREEARTAALKAKQEASGKHAKPKVELAKIKPSAPLVARETPAEPVQPVLRMPAPDGLPMARNL